MSAAQDVEDYINDLLQEIGCSENYVPEPEQAPARATPLGVPDFNWNSYHSGASLDSLLEALAVAWGVSKDEVETNIQSEGFVVFTDPHPPEQPYHRHFYCESIERLEALIAACSARRQNIHEKVLRPMRLVIDVDAIEADVVQKGFCEFSMLDTIATAFCLEAFELLAYCPKTPPMYSGSDLTLDSLNRGISIATSSGAGKFSFHLVLVGFRVANSDVLKAFTKGVQGRLSLDLPGVIDVGLPKSKFNLRLLGAYKGSRLKAPVDSSLPPDLKYHLVAPPEAIEPFILKSSYDGGASAESSSDSVPSVTDDEAEMLARLVVDKFPNVSLRPRSNNPRFMNFDRSQRGACVICKRVHEHDGMYAWVGHDRDILYVRCRRAPEDTPNVQIGLKGVPGFCDVSKKPRLQRLCESKDTRLATSIRAPSAVYSAPRMMEYPLDKDTLAIKANCGLGKTYSLFEYLKAIEPQVLDWKVRREVEDGARLRSGSSYVPLSEDEMARRIHARGGLPSQPLTVLFISYRRSLTHELVKKANAAGIQLESYLDLKEESEIKLRFHPKVVVQVESLRKISWVSIYGRGVVSTPDIVVIDEFSSILGQIDSRLTPR